LLLPAQAVQWEYYGVKNLLIQKLFSISVSAEIFEPHGFLLFFMLLLYPFNLQKKLQHVGVEVSAGIIFKRIHNLQWGYNGNFYHFRCREA